MCVHASVRVHVSVLMCVCTKSFLWFHSCRAYILIYESQIDKDINQLDNKFQNNLFKCLISELVSMLYMYM